MLTYKLGSLQHFAGGWLTLKKKRTNSWIKWTHTEIARLKQLVDDGNLTIAEIAADLGRAIRGVSDKKRRLGLSIPRRFSTSCPKTLAGIIKFKMAGWNIAEIAKVHGVNPSRISVILCANGFKGFLWARPQRTEPFRPWSEFELAGLRRDIKKGYSFEHICAQRLHRTPAAIRKRARQMTRYWLSPEQRAERDQARRRFLHLPEDTEQERD